MESLTTDNKAEIKPTFNEQDLKLLKEYFEFNEKYFWLVNDALTTQLLKNPLWGPILKAQTPEQLKRQNERSFELQRAAIYDNNWADYTQHVIDQGITYAKMNVKYSDWYMLIKMYKDYVFPYIKDEFPNDVKKVMRVVNGLNILLDYSMYLITEAYFRKKNKMVNQYLHFFQNSYDLACIAKTDGYFEILNPAFERVLGYTEKELLSQPFFTFIHPDDIEATSKEVEKLAAGAVTINFTNRYRKKDGDYLWFAWNATPDNKTGKLYCITRDITERIKDEKEIIDLNASLEKRIAERTHQLEVSNKELEAFSYSISHDLRAPLRAINGYSQMLVEDYSAQLDDEGIRLLLVVKNSATKMGKLIDDLLSFSRLGKTGINKNSINMKKIALSVFANLRESMPNKAKLLIAELHSSEADYALILQVWVNLLSNAVKYSSRKEHPVIEISSEQKDGEVIYSVADNGAGFDMEYAHNLFGVFQRLHSEEEFEGTGVGLALVQRIIIRHGGKVWARGETGKGATFYFSLPDKTTL